MKTERLIPILTLLFALIGLHQVEATVIANASFETGDFSGWVAEDLSGNDLPLLVEQTGIYRGFGFFSSDPTDGIFTAMHGFDGNGPGTISIGQDLLITDNYISFDYRAAWDLITFGGGTEARLIDVNVEEAGGGANLFTQNILVANPQARVLDTGNLTASINVSDFIGQTVRFSVDSYVPEERTGPAFVTIDNFRSSSAPIPEPSSILLLGAGIAGIIFVSKRKK